LHSLSDGFHGHAIKFHPAFYGTSLVIKNFERSRSADLNLGFILLNTDTDLAQGLEVLPAMRWKDLLAARLKKPDESCRKTNRKYDGTKNAG